MQQGNDEVLVGCYCDLSVCGVVLSCYAIHIERSKHSNKNYQAHCDLDDTIACSYVLTSE